MTDNTTQQTNREWLESLTEGAPVLIVHGWEYAGKPRQTATGTVKRVTEWQIKVAIDDSNAKLRREENKDGVIVFNRYDGKARGYCDRACLVREYNPEDDMRRHLQEQASQAVSRVSDMDELRAIIAKYSKPKESDQ